ncbi:MAG: hypothetical protein CL662_08985 [Bacteroidetes bacterium]|jgi:hypothetical protein|nr:hypothetical protein [Bacteroidota bacterium]|tara:strand:- start:460 stop:1782 length:1323 start_codon:yes stop_codon:yes gene_type:complete
MKLLIVNTDVLIVIKRSLLFLFMMLMLINCSRVVLEGDRENRNIRITDPYKGTVTIRFQFINNLVVIPARVNNSPELKFILDTGAGRTIITELGADQSFEIEYEENILLNGLGKGEPLSALISRGNRVFLKDIEGKEQSVVFILEGRFNISGFMGTQVNGLLGYDIFDNFIVEIDYVRERLYLHDPDYYKDEYEKRKAEDSWTYVPLTIADNKLYATAEILESDSTVKKLKLLIDSGASHTIFIYPGNDGDDISVPDNNIYSYLGTGLNGEIFGRIGRIPQIRIAGIEIDNPIVSYPDLEDIDKAVFLHGREGSIGSDILKRFDIIYNYADNGMLIRRNNYFRNKFRYNASGIELITPVLDFPYYVISEIRENSPADKAGLMKDDILIEVESQKAFTYSLNELINLFQSTEEKNISLLIQRENDYLRFNIKLENELEIVN